MNVNLEMGPRDSFTSPNGNSFSRFQWACIGRGQTELDPGSSPSAGGLSFLFKTLVEIAVQPESGPFPEDQPIPVESIIATIDVIFALQYLTDIPVVDLDVEGLDQFMQYNAPYHLWPYWRELVQNLSLRAQIPVPNLPPYQVPAPVKPAKVESEK